MMEQSDAARHDARTEPSAAQNDERKAYTPPAITHELALETRAGSPIGMLNPFDPRPKI